MEILQKIVDKEEERKEILRAYRSLLRSARPYIKKGDTSSIRQAFEISLEAHKDMRRKSGEPYILHPIAVAKIVAKEIGLGTKAIICALLHDTVEDTHITLEDVKQEFGSEVARIVDGLTKISGIFDVETSQQAENFRKILLTLADDVIVILVKVADRLHNMRTLKFMPAHKQLKIASETMLLYAPLAHRLGLYAIKSELEDLSMKFSEPKIYKDIASQLEQKKKERQRYISDFIKPIKRSLLREKITCRVVGRPKSIFSIWNKMKKKRVAFDEVYDLFAIRIIIDAKPAREKSVCWRAYSIVTDFYHPNPDRLRDWISNPKSNGYESLHTTVMGPKGRWVEVQIRTERMDEIAEKGFAAHWKYKEGADETKLDNWLGQVREQLKDPDSNTLEFLDDFQLNLFSKEIYVFTPKGDLKPLPMGATALDFAFDIHTDIGEKCIGAKVNHKLVPISYTLKNGDQIEIITSKKQKPNEEWLKKVVTSKARTKIKQSLKEIKRRNAQDGREILQRKMRNMKINFSDSNIALITSFFGFSNSQDLFLLAFTKKEALKRINELENIGGKLQVIKKEQEAKPAAKDFDHTLKETLKKNAELLIFGENSDKIDYKLAKCCNPIPGDDVIGFITVSDGIKIHRRSCNNVTHLMGKHSYRMVKTSWTNQHEIAFLTGLIIKGIDDFGLVNKLTSIISSEMNINMRSISIESEDGIFEGNIIIYVNDTQELEQLIKKIEDVEGVLSVERYETE